MITLNAARMREADRRCIHEIGIPGAVLMNNAGAAVFRELDRGPVAVVCGKGNNGGDGFVVARLALLAGWRTHLVLVAGPGDIHGDAASFMNAYRRLGGTMQAVQSAHETAAAIAALRDSAIIVDALLGTGIHGDVRDPYRAAIAAWPAVRTVAVDVPSGLDVDSGLPCGVCVKADVTVTFQFAKTGLLVPSAQPYVGRLVIADIGIPNICADDTAWARLQAGWEAQP